MTQTEKSTDKGRDASGRSLLKRIKRQFVILSVRRDIASEAGQARLRAIVEQHRITHSRLGHSRSSARLQWMLDANDLDAIADFCIKVLTVRSLSKAALAKIVGVIVGITLCVSVIGYLLIQFYV